jgi:DNA-damage-inducible protein D
MSTLNAKEYKSFEAIKHVSDDGNEFWYARELAPILEYVQWRNFAKVLDRAMLACKNSRYAIPDHFAEVSKIVEAGATSKPVIDYKLTRYACYLIVQNGDSRKEVIALGQTYFAIQTRRQGVAILSNGTRCLPNPPITLGSLAMKSMRHFRMPVIWDYTAG